MTRTPSIAAVSISDIYSLFHFESVQLQFSNMKSDKWLLPILPLVIYSFGEKAEGETDNVSFNPLAF